MRRFTCELTLTISSLLLLLLTHQSSRKPFTWFKCWGRKLARGLLLIFLTFEPNSVYLIASPNVVLILETSWTLFKLGGWRKLIHILLFRSMIEHKAFLSVWLRKEYAVFGAVQHVMFMQERLWVKCCYMCELWVQFSACAFMLKSCWSLFKFEPALLKSAGSKL